MKDIYEEHPKWNELVNLCNKIEGLKNKAHKLREEIDKDLFEKKEVVGCNDYIHRERLCFKCRKLKTGEEL